MTVDLRGARWRKSSHSDAAPNGCVEVASNLPGVVAVRDSTDPHGPNLTFRTSEWSTFIEAIKRGHFDQ